jgi:hypothetical protein
LRVTPSIRLSPKPAEPEAAICTAPPRVFLACFLLPGYGSAWLWGERTRTDLLVTLPLTALFASLLFGAA